MAMVSLFKRQCFAGLFFWSSLSSALSTRATSPENICGTSNGFSCDPNSPNGGPCCSASGYCGSTSDYCGTGCQSAYGTCASTSTPGSSCSTVSGVGVFSDYVVYDFSSATSLPKGLVAVEDPALQVSTAPYSYDTQPSNVAVAGGSMNLVVPGGQTSSPIHSAQVQTTAGDILYASVRTTAILSAVPGTCHGFFFYKSDEQEIDIEYLSDPTSTSNPGGGSTPMHFTNQATDGVHADEAYATYAMPSDAHTSTHEYRIDWLPGHTAFFIDGEQVQEFTKDVPTEAGTWIWNNWSNGDKGWSVGPPQSDNILKITKIEMYYNTSSSSC